MSDTIKIKLTIADRVYPLTIAPDQEPALRNSAKKIEGMIKQLEKNYAVRDKQDVLAMCALQYAARVEKQEQNPESNEADRLKTQELIDLIDVHIATY
ncbi:MAG: cell division protein ZapA [Flavobacteriaceae bacterium]|nr:cell division protein ZapA [Flavobacteriaceae bacterium]